MSEDADSVLPSVARPTVTALLLACGALLLWSAAGPRAPARGPAAPPSAWTAGEATSRLIQFDSITDSLARAVERLAWQPSILPTVGPLTSPFAGERLHPLLHVRRPHEGVDVSARMGAPVVAPANGVVRAVGRREGYGLVLEIDHGHDVVTRLAHLSRVVVRVGERVARGQVVANVGNSGLSTGPHLHYELRVRGRHIDPLRAVFEYQLHP